MNNIYQKIKTIAATLFITCAASNFVSAQTQCITDGGFEAGPGGGAWTETSTNFGTPLCDLANCGTGTGTGAHTGTYWAWFGGFTAGIEQGELSQSVTIPAGATSADLTFYLEQILCDSSIDYLAVLMDADTIFFTDGSSSLCGALGYSLQTIDVMTYADGLPHTLLFSSTTFAANAGPSNIFVDDVSLLATTGGTGGPDCADTLTYSPALAITDGDTLGVSDAQTVSGITGTLGASVSLLAVNVTCTHTWVGDLRFILTAPNGTALALLDRPGVPASTFGCDGDNLNLTIVRGTGNDAEGVCNPAVPTINGSYTAAYNLDLDAINIAGGSPNGTWTLAAADFATPDPGTIDTWSLIFSTGPVASWNPPDTVCATSGTLNLSTYVTGTAGGTFTGQGVTGTTFDPSGLSGSIAIAYGVSDVSGCTDTLVQNIYVVNGLPVVSFTANVNGNTVSFTNTSTNAAGYAWDFGDGLSDNTANPTHNYAATGTYTVILTATNICGTSSDSLTVTTGCIPDTVVVIDGGFEAGIGAGTWTETSTNFGTPLCDLALCGTGSGTGPHAGAIWYWLGGFGGGIEQAEVSQSVLIPTGTASLSFYLEQIVCDSSIDYMVVMLDTDTMFYTDGGSSLCGQLGYTLQVVDVSAKADGNTHTLSVNGTTFAANAGVTNFFVDDIQIGVCTAVGITEVLSNASVELAPNPASDNINLTFTNVKTEVSVTVVNAIGQQVYSERFDNQGNSIQSIDISKWNAGVYTVNVKAYNQEFIKKFVKN